MLIHSCLFICVWKKIKQNIRSHMQVLSIRYYLVNRYYRRANQKFLPFRYLNYLLIVVNHIGTGHYSEENWMIEQDRYLCLLGTIVLLKLLKMKQYKMVRHCYIVNQLPDKSLINQSCSKEILFKMLSNNCMFITYLLLTICFSAISYTKVKFYFWKSR